MCFHKEIDNDKYVDAIKYEYIISITVQVEIFAGGKSLRCWLPYKIKKVELRTPK